MKSIVKYIILICVLLTFTQCYDRDVLGHKDGVSLPEVTGLQTSLAGNTVTLTWNLPSNISDEVNQPISVFVQIYKGTVRESFHYLRNDPTTFSYTLEEPQKSYRAVVKLEGTLKNPEYGKSSYILSLGQTVEIN